MRSLPPTARRCILAVALAYLVVAVLAALSWPGLLTAYLPTLAALLVSAAVAEHFAIPMVRGGYISVSTVPHVAAALVLPPFGAVLVAFVGILQQQVIAREPLFKVLFNASATGLTVGVVALLGRALLGPGLLPQRPGLSELAVLGAVALTYVVLNGALTAAIVGLASNRSVRYIWREHTRRTWIAEFALAVLGGLLAFVWTHSPVWSVVVALPMAVAHLTLDYLYRIETETGAAVRTMAKIIDERDHYTYFHSRNVARYAEALAEEMGLPAGEIELISSAASVHDLGKIGVPDRVLNKPGPLDQSEFEGMRSHPVVGARILAHFRAYRDGVKYVLYHHERYDGKGYPTGLSGEQIPLGARIIAVADAFDAMTTDRPYRRRLTRAEAVQRLKEGRGTQFDPAVVEHFLRVLERTDFGLAPQPVLLKRRQHLPEAPERPEGDVPAEREAG